MKAVLFLATVLAVGQSIPYEDLYMNEWNLFKIEHKKLYASLEEDTYRMKIFIQNKNRIAEHNARYYKGEESYTMGLNQFADMLPEELGNLRGFKHIPSNVDVPEFDMEAYPAPPPSFNWVEKNVVVPVKNQGSCGSCYAFSIVGSLESQNALVNKKLVSLSEQNIVDCSSEYGNLGCLGGCTLQSCKYVRDNKGINTEASYPYVGKQGKCKFNNKTIGAVVKECFKVPEKEEELKSAIANIGPISVSIDATAAFGVYRSGIYEDKKCKSKEDDLNHAVLLVGYGTDEATKKDYWLVKNSWGKAWGDNGYIKMRRNFNNMCGIATHAIYGTIVKK